MKIFETTTQDGHLLIDLEDISSFRVEYPFQKGFMKATIILKNGSSLILVNYTSIPSDHGIIVNNISLVIDEILSYLRRRKGY